MFVFRSRRSNLVRRLWKLHQAGHSDGEAGGPVSEARVTLNTNNNIDTRLRLL